MKNFHSDSNHKQNIFGDCLLLAGGKSSRMGFDKQTLKMEDDKVLAHEIIQALKKRFSCVFVATSKPALYEGLDVVPINDILSDLGPMSGLLSGLSLCTSEYLYVTACDMQPPSEQYLDFLIGLTQNQDARAFVTEQNNHIQPFQGFYAKTLQAPLAAFLRNKGRGIVHFLNSIDCKYVNIEEIMDTHSFLSPGLFINQNYIDKEENTLLESLEPMYTHCPCVKVTKEQNRRFTDLIAIEKTKDLYVDSVYVASLHFTPAGEEALFYGHLLSQGFIGSLTDVITMEISMDKAEVTLKTKMHIKSQATINQDSIKKKNSKFDKNQIIRLSAIFLNMSKVFEKTGAVHSCALCAQGEIICFYEDIGRHNAIDKVIGYALLHNIDLSDKFILTSGRIPLEIVKKIKNAQVPLLVSRSAPTNLALDYARKNGICLVGFSRNSRFNVYTCFHMVD